MKDSPLKCDFPETELEQQLEKKLYRTHGARLASPPARKVAGVSDSSEDMDQGVAYISERFMDIRTAFLSLRRAMPAIISMFMIIVLALGWVVSLFYSKALLAVLVAFGPVWVAVYLFEIFFPLTLPVRIDRKERVVYVGHRGNIWALALYGNGSTTPTCSCGKSITFVGSAPRCPCSARRSLLDLKKETCIGNGILLSGITTKGLLKKTSIISPG
jgi:hypothetical protein